MTKFEILSKLSAMSRHDIEFLFSLLYDDLSPAEKLNHHSVLHNYGFSSVHSKTTWITEHLLSRPFHKNNHYLERLGFSASSNKKPKSFAPSWMQAREAIVEDYTKAVTDDLDTTKTTSVQLLNPRWQPIEETDTSGLTIGNAADLLCDVKGIPDGATVTFDIYDCTTKPPQRIDTVSGKINSGIACASWTSDNKLVPESCAQVEFEASAKSKFSSKCAIPIVQLIPATVRLHINPQDADSRDDVFTLYSTDQAKTITIVQTVADDFIDGNDYVDLHYENLRSDLRYTLELDLGAQGTMYNLFTDALIKDWKI